MKMERKSSVILMEEVLQEITHKKVLEKFKKPKRWVDRFFKTIPITCIFFVLGWICHMPLTFNSLVIILILEFLCVFGTMLFLMNKQEKFRRYFKNELQGSDEVVKEYYTRLKSLRAQVINKIAETNVELEQYGKDLEYYQNLINTEEKS